MLTERPAILDRHVLALDETGFPQASSECLHQVRGIIRRPGAEIPDHRHRCLLRARGERPRCRPADERDELAAFHSITSSASNCIMLGNARPSALAAFKLITSSKLVGCRTGRSIGLAPLTIRPA